MRIGYLINSKIQVTKLAVSVLGLICANFATPIFANDYGVSVLNERLISNGVNGFPAHLDPYDRFGVAVAVLGDLDGDGVTDLVVGAETDDDGGLNRGAIYTLFMNADGTIKSAQKISDTEGNFTGTLVNKNHFGVAIASLGDLDGDSLPDIAVSSYQDYGQDAVWILFLNSDGSIKSHKKITGNQNGFDGEIDDTDYFGIALAAPGDINGNGIIDLAVGAHYDDDGAINAGAVWILFLNADGTVKDEQKISAFEGGFTGILDPYNGFAGALGNLGDLNKDGVPDLVVGAHNDDDGGPDKGAVWILFLNADGSVKASQKISATEGEFTGILEYNTGFGGAVISAGDLDNDNVPDLIVGANNDHRPSGSVFGRGALWFLFLNPDGSVKNYQKIREGQGGLEGPLDIERMGRAVANLGDLDGDGFTDIATGSFFYGERRGALRILSLQQNVGGTVRGMVPTTVQCFNQTSAQNVFIQLDGGEKSWDCDEAGLEISPNDIVEISIEGAAGQ